MALIMILAVLWTRGLCKDKDIILSEIQACESLMNDTSEADKNVIETELSELKMTLDLLP